MNKRLLSGTVAAFALAVFVAMPAMAQSFNVYTGGTRGDYYSHFCPPLKAVADAATWQNYTCVPTDGTPDNMARLNNDPNGVALLQGNVYASLKADRPDEFANVEVAREGAAFEVVLAVMSERIYNRSQGSWDAIVRKGNLRFATSSENSGPGQTFRDFQKLDSRLAGASVTFAKDMDTALSMLVSGETDVVLMAQFANPDNARYQFISSNNLKMAGVVFRELKGLSIPGTDLSAFELCQNVPVDFSGGFLGFGRTAVTVDTACTPMLYGVHADADPDLVEGLANATDEQLLPPPGTDFFKVLDSIKVATGGALTSALEQANELGSKINF